jgi:hypothetical protein
VPPHSAEANLCTIKRFGNSLYSIRDVSSFLLSEINMGDRLCKKHQSNRVKESQEPYPLIATTSGAKEFRTSQTGFHNLRNVISSAMWFEKTVYLSKVVGSTS